MGNMEVHGVLANRLVPTGNDCEFVTSWDGAAIDRLKGAERQQFIAIIGQMGEESRVAQGLGQILTSYERMQCAGMRLYILARRVHGRVDCIGILKMGRKKLFIRMPDSSFIEVTPLCCLDFYIHQSIQRGGFGRRIFDAMVTAEGSSPEQIAYDRPSPKLIGFLRKHFSLSSFTPQENNFVLFHQYFNSPEGTAGSSRRQQGRRSHRSMPDAATPAIPLLTVEA